MSASTVVGALLLYTTGSLRRAQDDTVGADACGTHKCVPYGILRVRWRREQAPALRWGTDLSVPLHRAIV